MHRTSWRRLFEPHHTSIITEYLPATTTFRSGWKRSHRRLHSRRDLLLLNSSQRMGQKPYYHVNIHHFDQQANISFPPINLRAAQSAMYPTKDKYVHEPQRSVVIHKQQEPLVLDNGIGITSEESKHPRPSPPRRNSLTKSRHPISLPNSSLRDSSLSRTLSHHRHQDPPHT